MQTPLPRMEHWEYRTLRMNHETGRHNNEWYDDYVVIYSDGTRLWGIENIFRRYLDDGGWELITVFPSSFHLNHTNGIIETDVLTAIFRRKILI